jgi:hypothetical protein
LFLFQGRSISLDRYATLFFLRTVSSSVHNRLGKDNPRRLFTSSISLSSLSHVHMLIVYAHSHWVGYERSFIILNPSSAVNAFRVFVLTFPAEPTLSIRDITVSSFGASIIITTSYSPKV